MCVDASAFVEALPSLWDDFPRSENLETTRFVNVLERVSGLTRPDEERRPTGVTDDAVLQSVDDPNDVAVWNDFAKPHSSRIRIIRGASECDAVHRRSGRDGVWLLTQS